MGEKTFGIEFKGYWPDRRRELIPAFAVGG